MKKKRKNVSKPIIKNKGKLKKFVPISKVGLSKLNLKMLPANKIDLVSQAIATAATSIAGFNPVINYDINLETKISDLRFDVKSLHNHIQKHIVPLPNDIVSKFINCKKVCIKRANFTTTLKDKNEEADVERMLLLGFVGKKIVPFQLNFMTLKNGKNFVNLGAILGGKIFVSCERYDEREGHNNTFYGEEKKKIDKNNNTMFYSPAHLHYYDIKSLVSLYDALVREGYTPMEVVSSRIATKMEAIPFDKINQANVKKFFIEKYNIKTGNESLFDADMNIEQCLEIISKNNLLYSRLNEEKIYNQNEEIIPTQNEKTPKKHKKFYYDNSK